MLVLCVELETGWRAVWEPELTPLLHGPCKLNPPLKILAISRRTPTSNIAVSRRRRVETHASPTISNYVQVTSNALQTPESRDARGKTRKMRRSPVQPALPCGATQWKRRNTESFHTPHGEILLRVAFDRLVQSTPFQRGDIYDG